MALLVRTADFPVRCKGLPRQHSGSGIYTSMAGPIRVLLADDSEPIRQAIRTLLKDEPTISVSGEASTYTELSEKLIESDPELVVLDIHMPGLNEADSVKGVLRGSCLLAISFANDEETKQLAQSYGALTLLDKIELGRTLIPAIKECVNRQKKMQHA